MFKIIRRLTPKQKFKKVQIYAENGQVLSKSAEALAIREHFQSVFQGQEVLIYAGTHMASAPFTHEEDLHALHQICPNHQGYPPTLRTGSMLACCGLADLLHHQLPSFLHASPPKVPQHWKDGWLALLGKPTKCGRSPGDFRPICLQDPTGKAMIHILTKRLQPVVQQYATTRPQHAYLPHRSTEGALLGQLHKCRMIRDRFQEATPNI